MVPLRRGAEGAVRITQKSPSTASQSQQPNYNTHQIKIEMWITCYTRDFCQYRKSKQGQ